MKKWQINPYPDKTSLVERILRNRGVTDPAAFLSPKLADLCDPFDIPNIEKAARRVLLAKERGEKVVVYGDYDVDGVTGTTILVHLLKKLGLDVHYYIPHRYGEGYSLSLESVTKIAGDGAKLLVTVDCGISSLNEIAEAARLGLEVVVTDHHNLPATLPLAEAIVNPKMITDTTHSSRELSGAGVAFKFGWAILRLSGSKDSQYLTSLLDLVALGTLSDVVPLTGENRVLAACGLKVLNERRRLGVKHLAESASINGQITENKVYFGLAPRINAAGRLEHAYHSVDLLLTDDPIEASRLSGELNRINTQRQGIGRDIKDEVFAKIAENDDSKLLLLSGEDWHPGVIGIVASRVVDVYNRPTVLIGINEGIGRGSARSIDGVNIYELLDSCRDLFIDFGGHEGAAGFEIEPDNIPLLKERLLAEVEKRINSDQLVQQLTIDAEIQPSEITLGLVEELKKLAPFGEGNPEPILALLGVTLSDWKRVGSEGKHLKLWVEKDGTKLEVIAFNQGPLAKTLSDETIYDLAFNLGSNEYNGFENVQLSLVDMREAQ